VRVSCRLFINFGCVVCYTDASFLDEWAFDKLAGLLNGSSTDARLKGSLGGDGLIIFIHLLGCDTNGHAHRPYSPIYLNNIRLVDKGVENSIRLLEEVFPDKQTAYIFTADHGMSNKGKKLNTGSLDPI
jgi:phosphatidylinositol glycan class N